MRLQLPLCFLCHAQMRCHLRKTGSLWLPKIMSAIESKKTITFNKIIKNNDLHEQLTVINTKTKNMNCHFLFNGDFHIKIYSHHILHLFWCISEFFYYCVLR